MTPLNYLTATECLALFRSGELSPLDVLDAQLAQIEQHDPAINAFTETFVDEARSRARAAEERYRTSTARPLEGITIAAKEKHYMQGKLVTEGSRAWDGFVPTENAPIIDRVIDAGAIIHGRTCTPEFSIAAFTHSDKWGITRNPWNLEFSPGGSSGGSGAALAAGMTTLATASDIGGSTRGPAAFTGTVGFKAPYGRIPGIGPMSLDFYRGDGPLGRSIDDVALLTNVMSGRDPRDHVSLGEQSTIPMHHADIAGMRIALSIDLGGFVVDAEIEHNTRELARRLERAGAIVTEVTPTWTPDDMIAAAVPHFAQMMGTMVRQTVSDEDLLSDYARDFLAQTESALARSAMFDAARREYAMQQELARILSGHDALICPTTAAVGFPAGDSLTDGIQINGALVSGLAGTMTIPFNISNRCPVLAVPSGHARNGMPTGVQIVGHTYDDASVFRVGKAIEALRPWEYRDGHWPQIPVE